MGQIRTGSLIFRDAVLLVHVGGLYDSMIILFG